MSPSILWSSLVLLLLASTMIPPTRAVPRREWPDIEVESPFRVYATDDPGGCEVPPSKAIPMINAGFTKVACPFGAVLIGATDAYPDEYVLFGANSLANILDQDADGVVDDLSVVEKLHYRTNDNSGAMLACGVSEREEKREEQLSGVVFDYTFSCQTWKSWQDDDCSPRERERTFMGIMMEEAFHLVHQNGYAVVYPEQLGYDYTSTVIGRETARLQCARPGWLHPENRCPRRRDPEDPPVTVRGTCADPSCDISEFYKMALFLLVGMGSQNDPDGPGVWLSQYMPGRTADVEALVSDEFKAMIADPRLHQLRAPLTGSYRVAAVSDVPPPGSNEPPEPAPNPTPQPIPPPPDEEDDRLVCPGQPPDNYCDCGSDCTENPRWCACEEGAVCCGNSAPEPAPNPTQQPILPPPTAPAPTTRPRKSRKSAKRKRAKKGKN